MDQVSVIHSFESDSTLLVDVPSFILRQPLARPDRYFSSGKGDAHNEFMDALFSSGDFSEPQTHDNNGEKELSVMRVIPVRGSKQFHNSFLTRCELYCRLCYRLERAVEWILKKRPSQCSKRFVSSDPGASSAFDIDSLSHVVYPLEPTAFVAAAFSLPLLVSVSSAVSTDDEIAAKEGEYDASPSSQSLGNVPFCFFYNFPEKRMLISSNAVSGASKNSGGTVCAEMSRMTLFERVISISNAVGVCGAVPPLHNTLSIHNRTKIGLTLEVYLEGRLPRCVNDGGAPPPESHGDLFSLWRDDILWRLLGSLVSALAVVHASGFHFCGELSAEDILCFALPGIDDVDAGGDKTVLRGQEGSLSVSRRFSEWVAMNQRHWFIGETTPAHRAFFRFATLPRSLFVEESQDPAFVAAAQRRDTAALGRILVTVVEEWKRRRGPARANGCPELLFVAERMATVGEGGGGMMTAEAPAHRFAQLQAVQLRTHIWLLRLIIEERDTQLAAVTRDRNKSMAKKELEVDVHKSTSVSMHEKEHIARLQERERLITEREKKLDRFLELYEMTAERLDQLFVGTDGFDSLKASLAQTPVWTTAVDSASAAKTSSPSPSPSPSVPWASLAKGQQLKTTRRPAAAAAADAALLDQERPLQGLLRSSPSGNTSAPDSLSSTSLVSRPIATLSGKEKRATDGTPRRWVPRIAAENTSRRPVVSSVSPSLLHSNWKAVSSILTGVGISAASAVSRSVNVRRRKSASPGAIEAVLTARRKTPVSVGTTAVTAATTITTASTTTTAADALISSGKGKAPTRPPSAKRGPYATGAVGQSQPVTPLRGRNSSSAALEVPSGLPSPGVSPLMHPSNHNASLLSFTGCKTPSQAPLTSTPSQSFRKQTFSAWNKAPAFQTSGVPKDGLLKQLRASMSPGPVRELNVGSHLSARPVSALSSPLQGATTTRNKTSCREGFSHTTDPKESVITTSAAAAASDGIQTPFSRPRSGSKKDGKVNDSVEVIKMYQDDSRSPLPFNNSPSERAKLAAPPADLSPSATRSFANVGNAQQSQLHISYGSSGGAKQGTKPQQCREKRPEQQQQQEQREEMATPRTSRSRLVNDGWVNHHLEALEQLRHDFQHSEMAKSARDTPRVKGHGRCKERGAEVLKLSPARATPEKKLALGAGAADSGVAAPPTNNSAACM